MSVESSSQPPHGEARLVKRYANRKLYDTMDSRYVTLQQIAEYVRAGEEVRIVDNTTKEDLTNVTLAQIIYEEEKKGGTKRSKGLREFIQEGRHRIMVSLRDGPMGKLVTRREDDASESTTTTDENVAASSEEPKEREPRERKSPKEALDDLGRYADDRVKAIVQSATGTIQQLQGEVKRLQARIEELEDRLGRLGRRNKGS